MCGHCAIFSRLLLINAARLYKARISDQLEPIPARVQGIGKEIKAMAITPEIAALYDAAITADHVWSAALSEAFGRDACNARYDARGVSTERLASLCAAKLHTFTAYRLAAFPHASR